MYHYSYAASLILRNIKALEFHWKPLAESFDVVLVEDLVV